MSKHKRGHDLLVAFIRDQRKPGVAPPGFMFVLSRFATVVGASRQQLRWWMLGAVKPSPEMRSKLHEVTSGAVPRDSWG